MTAFKKTILGKILGNAAKVVLPVAGLITGIGAFSGVSKGVGVLTGVKNTFGGIGKGVSSIATKAKDLITGETAEQRKLIDDAKDKAASAQQKLSVANKLIATGMSKADAYSAAGVPADEVPGSTPVQSASMMPVIIFGGAIAALIALFAWLGKKK